MDRINGAGHVGRRFVTEDADLGRPPTLITDVWLNLVQEEIVNVILAAGGTLDGMQEDQLLQAINSLIQAESNTFVAVGGTADAIIATYAPVVAALTNGMTVYVRAASANATTTPTFTPANGVIAAKTIVKGAGTALVAGDIDGAGHWIELQYDTTLDKWVLQNPAKGVSIAPVGDATTAVKGKVQLATAAEAQAGTDALKAVVPSALAAAVLGFSQTWQAVTRTSGTTYTNSTGKPIILCLQVTVSSGQTTVVVAGVSLASIGAGSPGAGLNATFFIPAGATYVITDGGGNTHSAAEYR